MSIIAVILLIVAFLSATYALFESNGRSVLGWGVLALSLLLMIERWA